MNATSRRIPYWDNVKGFLIVLVVLGHTGSALGENWLSVVYAFHMPLFVFVSGFFSRKKDSLWDSIGKLILIFLFFNSLYLALDLFLGEKLSFTRLLTPSFALWYILSLIFWRAILFFTPQSFLDNRVLLLIVSLALSLLAGFVRIGSLLSFQRTFVFLPFFLAGFYARQLQLIDLNRKPDHRNIMAIALFLALSTLNYKYLPVFYANSFYVSGNGVVMRFIQIIIATILSWSVLMIVPNRQSIFTELGRNTMIIYLLHPPIIKCLKLLLNRALEMNPIIALIITIITISFLFLIRKLPILRPLQ